jgi:hypothetical protein
MKKLNSSLINSFNNRRNIGAPVESNAGDTALEDAADSRLGVLPALGSL